MDKKKKLKNYSCIIEILFEFLNEKLLREQHVF